jgi:hypothetical protein
MYAALVEKLGKLPANTVRPTSWFLISVTAFERLASLLRFNESTKLSLTKESRLGLWVWQKYMIFRRFFFSGFSR